LLFRKSTRRSVVVFTDKLWEMSDMVAILENWEVSAQ
jgi:hypothetical protein